MSHTANRTDSAEPAAIDSDEVRCACGLRIHGPGMSRGGHLICPRCGEPLSTSPEASSTHEIRSPISVRLARLAEGAKAQRLRAVQLLRQQLTPARLLVYLGLSSIVVTGWWSWRTYRLQSAMATLQIAVRDGKEALDEGRFQEAEELLRRAACAGRILGDATPGGRVAIQLHRESLIWLHLATADLETLFNSHQTLDLQSATSAFDHELAGRTMIFDGNLSAESVSETAIQPSNRSDGDTNRPSLHLRFDWSLLEQGHEIGLELGESAASLAIHAGESRRVIFGAQIAHLQPVGSGASQWLICVVPESVTLLTASAPLRRWHWPDEDAWLALLDKQKAALGIRE